jgi:hypothetical protein
MLQGFVRSRLVYSGAHEYGVDLDAMESDFVCVLDCSDHRLLALDVTVARNR